MKIDRIYQWLLGAACAVAVSGGMTACDSHEALAEISKVPAAGNGLPAGRFVVDYTVGEGTATRGVAAEGLAANQRIRSLLYLVYDADLSLVRKRVIPDINEQTVWPLRRETMTWAQREALKDTLNSKNSYTAYFIANVDPVLWKDEEVLPCPPKASMDEIFLHLPTQPFESHNMFYVWKGSIEYQPSAATPDVPRDHPLTQQIELKRILSRVEVTRIPETDKVIEDALDAKKTDAKPDSKPIYQTKLEDRMKDVLTQFVAAVDKHTAQHVLWEPNLTKLKNLLHSKVDTAQLSLYASYRTDLREKVKAHSLYQRRMMDWAAFSSFDLQIADPCEKFSLKDLQFHKSEATTTVPVHRYAVEKGKAVWVGFSEHEQPADVLQTDFNRWTGMILYLASQATDNQPLELSFSNPLPLNVAKNTRATFQCNPVATIESGEADYTAQVTYTVDMSRIFGTVEELVKSKEFFYDEINVSTVNQANFIRMINQALQDGGHTWDKFTFTLPIPESFQYTATISPTK